MTYIKDLADHVDNEVTLKGWVYNYRSSGSLVFVEMRDGTGLTQCVVAKDDVSEYVWEAATSLKQESSLEIIGTVKADDRSVGGHEIHVSNVKVIQVAENYPITPKEHGVEFLMNNRHLWLRSQRQWAAMRVRNEIIFAIHTFFQGRGFVQMDSPIFTGNAAEGSTTLLRPIILRKKHISHKQVSCMERLWLWHMGRSTLSGQPSGLRNLKPGVISLNFG